MIELYLSKVTESSETEQAGKLYARVSYKQAMTIQDMARHMAEHNTVFSEGSILGVLTDFVKCVREMVLMGNTVKGQGGIGIHRHAGRGSEDGCSCQDHQVAGSEHRRLHP